MQILIKNREMYRNLIIIAFLAFSQISKAQCPTWLNVTSQSQIDNFPINYPGCTDYNGTLEIDGTAITNLNGLSSISEIDNLSINNTSLTDMSGLNNLTKVVYRLNIAFNNDLTSLNGLDNLSFVGDFPNDPLMFEIHELRLWSNPSLTDISSLGSLVGVEGEFAIRDNDGLTNLNGLNSFLFARFMVINYNDGLINLNGLESLGNIEELLNISNNPSLTTLDGIQNLVTFPDGPFELVAIHSNNLLSICDFPNICNFLMNPPMDPDFVININNNASGCNSYSEVISLCQSGGCGSNIILTGTESGTMDTESMDWITSNQSITASAAVDYDGTSYVLLSPGFEIQVGAIFQAFIDGCGGQ